MFVSLGYGIVSQYMKLRENIFFNTAVEDSSALEYLGNFCLMPTRYLLGGKRVIDLTDTDRKKTFVIEQEFCYKKDSLLKTVELIVKIAASSIAFIPGIVLGSILKGVAFLVSSKTRDRHLQLQNFLNKEPDDLRLPIYQQEGINQLFTDESASTYVTLPGTDPIPASTYDTLASEKRVLVDALNAITNVFHEKEVPYWLDCGTCLGAFRHKGMIPWDEDIDIAIPVAEHDYVKRLLAHRLDPKLYQVQDWSSYDKPKTFLRVYVKSVNALIDIYHYTLNGGPDGNEKFYPKNSFDSEIDSTEKKVQYIFSHQNTWLPGENWKRRERIVCKPMPYTTLFPLKKAEFSGLKVNVPYNMERWLQSKYGDDLAPRSKWDSVTCQWVR